MPKRKKKRRPSIPSLLSAFLMTDSTVISEDQFRQHLETKYDLTPKVIDRLLTTSLSTGTIVRLETTSHTYLTTKLRLKVEDGISDFLETRRKLSNAPMMTPVAFKAAVRKAEKALGFMLSDEQLEVLRDVFVVGKKTVVVCGFAGSGKTTLMFAFRHIANEAGLRNNALLGMALAGKAVQRLEEVSGIHSQTLHSAFQLIPGVRRRRKALSFRRSAKVIVTDEASMISSYLFRQTVQRIPTNIRLLLVGDPSQLPPVSAGQPFADIIDGQLLPIIELTSFHRSGAETTLSRAAHQIRHNEAPDLDSDDSFIFYDAVETAAAYEQTLQAGIAAYRTEGVFSTQVMSLVHGTDVGTKALNAGLQEHLNPEAPEKMEIVLVKEPAKKHTPEKTVLLREGDKVLHSVNGLYISSTPKQAEEFMAGNTKGKRITVSNGVVGKLKQITDKYLYVEYEFPEAVVRYTKKMAETALEPAWCLTVHKCQGSEFERIVLPIVDTPSHRRIASNSALYTAVTRAKQRAEIVGDRDFFKYLCTVNGSRIKRYFGPRERETVLKVYIESRTALKPAKTR